jgi:GPH family glycoside/pentoside/hexuronide:cation symporter
MAGRCFDAITDPWIATLSDKSKSPRGRRISFMAKAAVPFAVLTALVFWTPVAYMSYINVIWLAVMLLAYYLFFTIYVTPYFALISELGHTSEERLNLSTYISLTFFIGTAISFQAPLIWNKFIEMGIDKVLSMRLTFAGLSFIALILLLIPVFTIDEKKYCDSTPSDISMMESLRITFKNKNFLVFAVSDLAYFLALTVFQTGLIYYITVLLGQAEALYSTLIVVLGFGSFIFYVPVNIIAKKVGKKKLMIIAFALFILMYCVTYFLGKDIIPMSQSAQAYLLVALAALPMAIFGILPNAILSDVAEYDAITTGKRREAIFFGVRTFMSKMGQMIAMLVFSSLLLLGRDVGNDIGIRLTGPVAAVFCIVGLLFFLMFDEKKILSKVDAKK